MKKSLILRSALSILALTLVSCASGPGTNTSTTTTTPQTSVTAATTPPPMRPTMGGYSGGMH